MLIKFLCFFFGHEYIVKAYTGGTFDAGPHPLTGENQMGSYYKLQRLDFCKRCGKKNN